MNLFFYFQVNLQSQKQALPSCLLGDHQEVPDAMPAACSRLSERNHKDIERHLVQHQQHCRGLQRGHLQAKVLCIQLSGTGRETLKCPENRNRSSGVSLMCPLFMFPDCLCSTHPDLCLCVPPRHPAHVRGAQRVSVFFFKQGLPPYLHF